MLHIGQRVGVYEVVGSLGAGGMGEVYRAKDTRLGREVALKVLPDRFAADPDRLSRFQREAQVLAALNHPHIAAIYGVEETAGVRALVLELVEGETLADRIAAEPIPIADAIVISKQIAEALEAAHEQGIVHRDLKPANVKVNADGRVKVLDFGLAKLAEQAAAAEKSSSLSMSPTITSPAMTNVGMVLGTAAYMSPEQARGRPADRRADIWAFGVVLFSMLSGGRVFAGETVTETLAQVLEREPDWRRLPARTPAAVRKLLQRCLTKDPRNRLQAIGDARIVLQELIENPREAEVVQGAVYPLWKKILPWAAAPVVLAAGLLLKGSPTPLERALLQFDFPLPANHALLHNNRHAVALSPDGRRVAFVAGTTSAPRRIFVRNLDLSSDTAIPGTEQAQTPFFSPDGNSLGFQQGQQIKKVALGGAAPSVVVENLNIDPGPDWGPPGITWGSNGFIVFPNNLGSGLSMVRDTGGKPEEFTQLDTAANEVSHRLPRFLPDASGVLFTVLRFSAVTPDWTRAQVWVKSLKDGQRRLLMENALDARYVGENILVFGRQGKLFAIPFDLSSLSVTGNEVQVLDGVTHSVYGQAAVTWTGAAQFDIAANGMLFYAPGSVEPPLLSSLVWFDRRGRPTPVPGMRSMFRFAARVLPDGSHIASSELYANKDIWVFDTARHTEDRVTDQGQNAYPIWAPNGSHFAFRSDRAGLLQIYLGDAQNPRNVKPLTQGPFDVPSSWTPDGKELLFTRGFSSLGGNTDIYAVSIEQPDNPRAVIANPADERFPEISPDGKWLAYCSDDTGRLELYVQPYPGPGARVTVTNGGGQDPAWSKNSNELFYRTGLQMMAVPYTVSGQSFIPGNPIALFQQASLGGGATVRATYDVAPDGRFLMNLSNIEAAAERERKIFPSTLRFVLNWTDEVRQLLSPP